MRSKWPVLIPALAAIVFASLTLRIALHKHLTIDEFQYAHAAWLVAHGQIPYRDFFDDRFPLLFQALGTLAGLKHANPEDIVHLRWAMLPLLLLTVALHALLNRGRGAAVALTGVALLLATSTFTTRATEIRPDPLAFALFLAAIVLLYSRGLTDRSAAFIAGLLVGASLWASLKVIIYGCIFAIALAVDLVHRRRRQQDPILRNDVLFVAGFATFAAVVAAYLFASDSAADWFTWTVRWAYVHERLYPKVSWLIAAGPFLRNYWWVLAFGLTGWIADLRAANREILLILALPFTFLSFAAQRAPVDYSVIPFIGILTIYAARGVFFLFGLRRIVISAMVTALCVYGATIAAMRAREAAGHTLDTQLAILHHLGTATSPADAVYDNTGAYFARPHAWYFFYTDEVLRRRLYDRINDDVRRALMESQTPAVLIDLRFKGLPPQLQTFIIEHYQPYAGDIRLWGMRFGPARALDAHFWAIRSGSYFVYPSSTIQNGTLRIADRTMTSPVFTLNAGDNRVTFTGAPSPFFILWLPRDGQPYVPSVTPSRSAFSFP